MYFSFEKNLLADATVTGNDKNIIQAVQISGYGDDIAAGWSI